MKEGKTDNWQKTFWVIWACVFMVCASYSMAVPFLPLFLVKELHLPALSAKMWSGVILSITFVFAGLMAPIWGARGDISGQKKNAIRAGIGLTLSYFGCSIVQNTWELLGIRAFMGIISGFVPACLALASGILPEEKVGWGMGLIQAANASGSITGPLLGGVLSQAFGMRMSFVGSSVLLGIATLLIFFYAEDLKPKAVAGEVSHGGTKAMLSDLKDILKNPIVVYILMLFAVVKACTMVVQPLLAIYVNDALKGAPSAVTISGFILSLAGIAGIMGAPFWGNRGHDYGYVKVLAVVMFGAGLVNMIQIAVESVWVFAVVYFVYGLFLAGASPNLFSYLVASTKVEERGKAFGLSTAADQLGGACGPFLGGFLGTFTSMGNIMGLTGFLLMLAGLHVYKTKVKSK
jgi:DHA1 family multidrug resistance protein-like MFS transporter